VDRLKPHSPAKGAHIEGRGSRSACHQRAALENDARNDQAAMPEMPLLVRHLAQHQGGAL
jgi:hypothetical protein